MDKRFVQLGMSYNTAMARLDRRVLFMLVQKAGLDTCHRCGKKIERVEDLSLEHKQPWLDADPTLFWDLENIAFSHKGCNYAAGRRGKMPGKEKVSKAPPGTAWCTGHQDYLPTENFGKCARTKNGLYSYCRDCRKKHGWSGRKEEQEKLEGLVHGQVRSS
jgi:hypothetical protein